MVTYTVIRNFAPRNILLIFSNRSDDFEIDLEAILRLSTVLTEKKNSAQFCSSSFAALRNLIKFDVKAVMVRRMSFNFTLCRPPVSELMFAELRDQHQTFLLCLFSSPSDFQEKSFHRHCSIKNSFYWF